MTRPGLCGLVLCLCLVACGGGEAGRSRSLDAGIPGSSEAGTSSDAALEQVELRINEVDCRAESVELINLGQGPLELAGLVITDDLLDESHRQPLTGVLQ